MGTPIKVLIIDDSEVDATFVERELTKAGYTLAVTRISDGPSMRSELALHTYDLIISDHNMPQFDSFSALQILREFGIDIPFIIVSGSIGEESAVDAMKAGAHDFVMKSYLKRLGPAVGRELREANVRVDMRKAQEDKERVEHELFFQSKMVAMGRMAGSIAHEVNNPIAIVMGKARQLVELTEETHPNLLMIAKFATTIEEMAARVAAIVHGLRTISRRSDHDPLVMTDLKSIIDGTIAVCAGRFHNDEILLKVGQIPSNLAINCRPSEIAQVLVNLLNNARDAVETLPKRWVRLDVEEHADTIAIVVTDSGEGVPPNVRAKLMTEFFTTKAAGRGSGLGLHISRRIATDHQGSLKLDESAPNTRFILTLPHSRGVARIA